MHPVNTLKASRWNSIIMPHRGPCTPLYFPPCEPRRIVGQLVMASSLGLDPAGIFRGADKPRRPSSARHSFVDDTCSAPDGVGALKRGISCLFSWCRPLFPFFFLLFQIIRIFRVSRWCAEIRIRPFVVSRPRGT